MISTTVLVLSVLILVVCYTISENAIGQVFIGGLTLVTMLITINSTQSFPQSLSSSLLVLASVMMLMGTVFIRHLMPKPQEKVEIKTAGFYSDLICFSLPITILIIAFGPTIIFGDWSDFRATRISSPKIVIFATCLFFLGVARLFAIRKEWSNAWRVLMGISLLFLFVVISREKIFFVPILLAAALDPKLKRFSNKLSILLAANFFILYFLATAIRWHGSFKDGIEISRFWGVLSAALEAGFEKHVYVQYTKVMEFFHINAFLGLDSLMRLILLPFDRLLGTEFAPDNPMYFYSTVAGTSENAIASSAHPTIYADLFGQIGLFTVFSISIIYLVVLKIGSVIQGRNDANILSAGLFIFLALILRGASFYALFYLALGFVIMILLSAPKKFLDIR